MNYKDSGFTLIEMIVALAIVSLVTAGLYVAYKGNSRAYTVTEETIHVQQAVRTAMHSIIRELRMAGYDPLDTGSFGILRAWEDNHGSSIEFSYDFLEDGNASALKNHRKFELVDLGENGILDLTLQKDGSGRSSISEGIEALGLAFAFDQDGDGKLDRTTANHVVWAVDLDNDGFLDTNLDTNDDGKIDEHDDANNDGVIEGVTLSHVIPLEKVRIAKIWILGRSALAYKRFSNNVARKYVAGRHIIEDTNDGYLRFLLEYTIKLRNMNS